MTPNPPMKSQLDCDEWIVAFVDVVGPDMLATDIPMTPKAIMARRTRLRNSGAWDVLKAKDISTSLFNRGYFNAIGRECCIDFDDHSEVELLEAALVLENAVSVLRQEANDRLASKAKEVSR